MLVSCCDPELTSIDNKLETLCQHLITTLMGILGGNEMPKKTVFSGTRSFYHEFKVKLHAEYVSGGTPPHRRSRWYPSRSHRQRAPRAQHCPWQRLCRRHAASAGRWSCPRRQPCPPPGYPSAARVQAAPCPCLHQWR